MLSSSSQSNTIKLSVCISTVNRAAFLGATLENLVAQATEELEIVVSDNASTDETGKVVAEYALRFPGCVTLGKRQTTVWTVISIARSL